MQESRSAYWVREVLVLLLIGRKPGAIFVSQSISLPNVIAFQQSFKNALICVVNLFLSAVVLYATTAVYFAGVMVRLMLTLTPVVCILAAIAFSVTLDNYLVDDRPSEGKDAVAEQASVESVAEENHKKKKKDLYDKVSRQTLLKS